MDGPVVGAIITASVAAAVAILGAVRGLYQSALDRRYDWRRRCLVEAQSAMLVLREALLSYGAALRPPPSALPLPAPASTPAPELAADPSSGVVLPSLTSPPSAAPPVATSPLAPSVGDPAPAQSFVMAVPEPVELRVTVARGRFAVARSRLDDPQLDAAYDTWDSRARESLISAQELPRSAEEEAFDEVNRLTGLALRSLRGTVPRRTQGSRTSRP